MKIPAKEIGQGTQEDPVTLYFSSSESSLLVWTPNSFPDDVESKSVEVIDISSCYRNFTTSIETFEEDFSTDDIDVTSFESEPSLTLEAQMG